MRDEILAAAQEYKNYNWKVVPIDSKTRAPITGAYAESYKDLETPAECLNCFGWSSQAFQSLAKIIEPDEIVIDTDTPEWLDRDWPVTPTVVTPRGLHLHFKRPSTLIMNQAAINCGDGFEVKAKGMLSSLPPGKHSSGAVYNWKHDHRTPMADLPQWCIDKINAYCEKTRDSSGRMSEEELNRLMAGVNGGERHDACIRLGGHLVHKVKQFDEIESNLIEWNARNSPPIAKDEFDSCLKSIRGWFDEAQENTPTSIEWIDKKVVGVVPANAKMPSKLIAEYAIRFRICDPESVVDGWKLPPEAFNHVLWAAPINIGREPLGAANSNDTKILIKARDALPELKESLKRVENGDQIHIIKAFLLKHCKGCQDPYTWDKFVRIHIQEGIFGVDRQEFDHRTASVLADVENEICGKNSRVKNTAKKKPEEPPADPAIVAKAEEIMKTGDPIGYILGVHQLIHVGDLELAKTLLAAIGSQSCLNSAGIQPKLNGDSGKGKSHCAKAMTHLIPAKYKLETSLSSKAIYYLAADLPDGVVIYCDDANLSDDMQDLIKRATTAFQEGTTHTTVSKDRTVSAMCTPKRVSWWLTSVDDSESLQLLNRQFGGGVDESSDQDSRVTEHQLAMAALGLPEFPLTEDVLICREIIRFVKETTFTVWIPYAKAINWNDKGNRRNLPIFLDLIKSFAVLRFMQRETNEKGLLVATIQDFEDAKALYIGRAENQGLKLTNPEKRVCMFLAKNGASTEEEISTALGVTASRISQILIGKGKGSDSGLKAKINIVRDEIMETESSGDAESRIGTSRRIVKFRLVSGLDKLGMFENVVSLDLSKLNHENAIGTPNLPPLYLKFTNIIDSGKQSFTQFTHILETKQNENFENTQYENSQDQNSGQILSLPLSQNAKRGKRGKEPSPNTESRGKAEVKGGVKEGVDVATDAGKRTPGISETHNESCIRKLLESAEIQVVQPEDADRVIAEMMESKE